MRTALAALVVLSAVAGPAGAEDVPDLAKYDCTRTDDGKTVAGDRLAAAGFRVMSRARFGDVNLMLMDPQSSTRANCFLRPPPR